MAINRDAGIRGSFDVMTLQEAADFLKVHPSTVYRVLKRKPGSIPGVFKIGSDFRFTLSGLREWMARGGDGRIGGS